MFKLPGVIQPEMNHSTLASNIDLVPTVLQLLEITEYELPGVDVLDKEILNEKNAPFYIAISMYVKGNKVELL